MNARDSQSRQRICLLAPPGCICTRWQGHDGPCESAPVNPGDLLEEFDAIVLQQAIQHRLPWRVESDWTEEVIAADGYCIAKCSTAGQARAIIAAAERLMRSA